MGALQTARPFEWRLQALVVACNSVPVVGVAVVIAHISLIGGVVTGGVLWFVGGVVVWGILGGALCCLLVASKLAKRRNWARFAAIGIYALGILFFVAIANSPTQHPLVDQRDLSVPPAHIPPRWIPYTALLWAAGRVLWGAEHILPYLNAVALGHLALRWRCFSRSVIPSQAAGS